MVGPGETFPENEQVERHVPYRLLVNQRRQVINRVHPLNVSLESADSPFGEVIVAERQPIFSLSSVDPLSALRNLTTTVGSGAVTHEIDEYRVLAPGVGDEARLESAEVGRYLPGFSSETGIGFRLDTINTDAVVEWGPYNGVDGMTFRYTGGGELEAVVWRDGVESVAVPRSQWNVDQLEGAGPSRIDINDYGGIEGMLQAGWVWQVRFTWYGYGLLEFRIVDTSVSDEFGQQVWSVHRVRITGNTSIRQPNLPIWVSCRDGVSAYIGGRQYSIVGGDRFTTSRPVGEWRLDQSITDDGNWYPVIAITRDPNLAFGAGVRVISDTYDINSDQKILVQAFVCPAGTVADGSFVIPTNVPTNESVMLANKTATNALTLTNCIPLDPLVVSSGSAKKGGVESSTAKRIDLPRDSELVVAVRGTGAGNATVDLALTWLEQR